MSNVPNPTEPESYELHVAMTARRATVNFKQARSQSWQLDGVDTTQQWPARRGSEPTVTAAKEHKHDRPCVPTHSAPATRSRRGDRDMPGPSSARTANDGPSSCRGRSRTTSTGTILSDPSSPSSPSDPPPSHGILDPLPPLRYPRALPALEKVMVEYAYSFPPLPPTPVAARFVASALASDPFHKLMTRYGYLLAAPPSSRMDALELLLSIAPTLPEAEGANLSRMVIAAYEDIDETASPHQHQGEWSDSGSDSSDDEDDLWHDPNSAPGNDETEERPASDSEEDEEDKRKGKGKDAEGSRPASEEERRPCPCGGECGAVCTYEMRVGGIPRPPKRPSLRKAKSAVIPTPAGEIARRRGLSIVRLADGAIHKANQACPSHGHGQAPTPPWSVNGLKSATSPGQPADKHEPQPGSRLSRRPSLAALSPLGMDFGNRSWVSHSSPAGKSPVSGSSSGVGLNAPSASSSLGPFAGGQYSMTGASGSNSSSSSLYGVAPTQAIGMFDSFLAARERELAARLEDKWGIRIGEEPFDYAQQFEAQQGGEREREREREKEKEESKMRGWFRRKSEAEAHESQSQLDGGRWFRRRASEADHVHHADGWFTIPRPKAKRLGLRRKTVGEDENHSIPVTPTATSHNTPTILSPATTPSFSTRPRAKTVAFADEVQLAEDDDEEEQGRDLPRPARPHVDEAKGYASDDSEPGFPDKYASSGSWDEDEIRAHLGELHLGIEGPPGRTHQDPKRKWKFGRR